MTEDRKSPSSSLDVEDSALSAGAGNSSYRTRFAAATMRDRIQGPSPEPDLSAARTASSYSADVSRTDTTLACGSSDGGRPTGRGMVQRIAPTKTMDNEEFSAYRNSMDIIQPSLSSEPLTGFCRDARRVSSQVIYCDLRPGHAGQHKQGVGHWMLTWDSART